MSMKIVAAALSAAGGILLLGPGQAAASTITGWNTGNVAVAPTPADGVTAYSVIYDRAPGDPGAVTNGRIAFTPPEAVSPGLTVENDAYELGGMPPRQVAAGCIRASSSTTCDGDFQSGKRFKQQITGTGPIDLVFDVDPMGAPVDLDGELDTTGNVGYQVFHRLVNLTGTDLRGFSLELGFGVGGGFTASTAGDGLGFSPTIELGPDDAAAFSQFPFGLFGDAASNPNFTLDGFFAPERAGFELSFSEDMIMSGDPYGPYSGLFGDWMSQEFAPTGAFWDFDNDPATDDLLMAWLTPGGDWELRRDVDEMDNPFSLVTPELFASLADVESRLMLSLLEGPIEDLANLNVNYAIQLGDVDFDAFTLRVSPKPVPLPATLPLVVAGVGALAAVRRRRPA